jgi:NAD(P)H-dependent FMN reductase
LDLADWPLPMDDETTIPALGTYESERTRAWSGKIDAAAGYVFVTPQYNWGYPASLKNALDHLHREWRHKAAAIVSYGGHGGGKCAAQLRQVLEALKMRVALTMPALVLTDTMIRATSVYPGHELVLHAPEIEQAIQELSALLSARPLDAAGHDA